MPILIHQTLEIPPRFHESIQLAEKTNNDGKYASTIKAMEIINDCILSGIG